MTYVHGKYHTDHFEIAILKYKKSDWLCLLLRWVTAWPWCCRQFYKGGMTWPRKRRSSYLVQYFSMTKEVQINELVVYGCKGFN